MKSILFASLVLLLVITPAFAAPLSDRTGLVNKLDVKTDGYTFQIETVANFDITNFEFDKNEKRLTLYITSGLENNLAEMYLPQKLLSGNFTFYINGTEFSQKIKNNNDISFITLNFTGSGNSKIDIIATKYLNDKNSTVEEIPSETPTTPNGGGCLIATATYGSELAPQVQQLRELRDNHLLQTESGTAFMKTFNDFYYSFSPTIADWERESPVFKEMVKIGITPMLSTLSIMSLADSGSEEQVLGYGIAVILANIGMYVGIPVFTTYLIQDKFRTRK